MASINCLVYKHIIDESLPSQSPAKDKVEHKVEHEFLSISISLKIIGCKKWLIASEPLVETESVVKTKSLVATESLAAT